MHYSNLFIFQKNTDATESIRGYKFQELRTLESWLQCKVKGEECKIYCDYEEDIFQYNPKSYNAEFRQIKIYSSKNFSFSSEEVRKGITHFFMLFVKPDYIFDEVEFVFETNNDIARVYGSNDADLLRDWFNNQEKLEDDLAEKCIAKIKSIVKLYIDDIVKKLAEKVTDDIKNAKNIFENLDNDFWLRFIKSIKWEFSNKSAEETVNICVLNIQSLISKLPFPISNEDYNTVFAVLQKEVGERSIVINPEERCLTIELLDEILLNLGDEFDKTYSESYKIWEDCEEIHDFIIGEFYKVLHSANYCRKKKYIEKHSALWKNLLKLYINHPNIIAYCKQEAIYELVWSILRPNLGEIMTASLVEVEQNIKEYFGSLSDFKEPKSFEDAINLLSIITTSQKLGLTNITKTQIVEWFSDLDKLIHERLLAAKSDNSRCGFLEINAMLQMQAMINKIHKNIVIDDIIKLLNEVISLLGKAPLFSVSQLSFWIDSMIDVFINYGNDDDEDKIQSLELISEELLPYVAKRESNHSTAKTYIERGKSYLISEKPLKVFKALNFFHKAKNLWLQDETFNGYTYSLINISNLYSRIGLNFASKHFAYASIWLAINKADSDLFKRISQGYELAFNADFKEGAWISALDNLKMYVASKSHFDLTGFDAINDIAIREILMQTTLILYAAPKLSPELKYYVESVKSEMSEFYTDLIKDSLNEMSKLESENIELSEILKNKLSSAPLSDLGKSRKISWSIFGTTWIVNFDNDYVTTAIAEEFCSLFQIIQADFVLGNTDLHLIKCEVEMNIVITDKFKVPEQLPSNEIYKWKVFLPKIDTDNNKELNLHCARISTITRFILNELSLLPNEDFSEFYDNLFKNGDLADKTFTVDLYQKIYRRLIEINIFNQSQKFNFSKIEYKFITAESDVIGWNEKISDKYSKEKSLEHIKNRYRIFERIVSVSLDKFKKDPNFNEAINKARSNGYLDWQILMSLSNSVVNYKANIQMNNLNLNGHENYQKVFAEIHQKDESENYLEIRFSDIFKLFEEQLQQLPIFVLQSFELENKSRFPNNKGVKELLDKRFNFNIDDIKELSPF